MCYLHAVMYFHFVVSSQDNVPLFTLLTLLIPAGEPHTPLVQHLLWITVRLYKHNDETQMTISSSSIYYKVLCINSCLYVIFF